MWLRDRAIREFHPGASVARDKFCGDRGVASLVRLLGLVE
jgi:hypothetical protein